MGLIGCKTPKGPPEDPLFLNRTPIEVKPVAGPPVHLVCTEPEMPSLPVARKDVQPRPPGIAEEQPGQPRLGQVKEPVPVQIIPPHD